MGLINKLFGSNKSSSASDRAGEFFDACESGQIEKVAQFLKIDKNSANTRSIIGITVLMNTAALGYINIVKLLIDNGAKINCQVTQGKSEGATALILAVAAKHYDITELLIENGALLDLQVKDGTTALMFASIRGYYDVVDLLIKNGALLNIQNRNGNTALMLATMNNHKNIVDLLIKNGANLDIKDENEGLTALMIAANGGYKDIIELLIEGGANLNIQDKLGFTALMFKNAITDASIASYLIEAGIDITICTTNGENALMLATNEGCEEVADLLKNKTHEMLKKKTEEITDKEIIINPKLMTEKRRAETTELVLSGGKSITSIKFESLEELFNAIPIFRDMFLQDFGFELKEGKSFYNFKATDCGGSVLICSNDIYYYEIPYQLDDLIPIVVRVTAESFNDETNVISFY